MNRKKLLRIPINKKQIASLKEDSFVWFSLLSSVFLIILLSLIIFLNWSRLPPRLPLFFSRPWGENQLSPSLGLWLLPALSFSILTLNLLLITSVFKQQILIRRILAGAALIITVLCFITAYKIISLIT
jgi:hypothetical protein